MTKRRTLPAPPLILEPLLLRVPSSQVQRLIKLAGRLESQGALTDGGEKSLQAGLEGRNGYSSLTSQDVRGWAHALVSPMWEAPDSEWERIVGAYLLRYDKGKPRRPNHLQRLYLEWSHDLAWTGLLRATIAHAGLWEELQLAVKRLHLDHPERTLWELVLASQNDTGPMHDAWVHELLDRRLLLQMCSGMPWPEARRLELLDEWAKSIEPGLAYDLICACVVPAGVAVSLPPYPSLQSLGRQALSESPEAHRAEFFCGYRAFLRDGRLVEPLFDTLSPGDPLMVVRFGPRPGRLWWRAVRDELLHLTELRSESSSR